MEYVNLGTTGLKVSRLCLGCMTYGIRAWRDWVLDEDAAGPSSSGRSKPASTSSTPPTCTRSASARRSPAGRCATSAQRDEVVIATKVFNPMGDDPNDRGLSRKHILHAIDASPAAARDRLRRPLPDPPLRPRHADRGDARGARRRRARRQGALHRRLEHVRLAVREDARTWPTSTAGRASSSMQNHYNLVYREEEREMIPLCRDEGIGVIPWSPLARGFLAGNRRAPGQRRDDPRRDRRLRPPSCTTRTTDFTRRRPRRRDRDEARRADRRRWRWPGCCAQPGVTAPIIGATQDRTTSTTRSPRSR